jgi:predicted metalloprotease
MESVCPHLTPYLELKPKFGLFADSGDLAADYFVIHELNGHDHLTKDGDHHVYYELCIWPKTKFGPEQAQIGAPTGPL